MFNEDLLIKECLSIMSKKCCPPIKPMLLIAIFFILLSTSVVVQAEKPMLPLSAEDINVLIPEIKAAEEKRFSNLKIDSEVWVETKADLSDPCEPWQRTPVYTSSTAWFSGGPEGKARVDIHKKVLEWIDGAAPYSETSYSEGFDGRYGRFVMHSSGYNEQTFPAKRGRILPDAPEGLKSGWTKRFTGRAFSLNFFFSDENYTFSDLFRWADDPNTKVISCFTFTREEFQGVQCIKIASKAAEFSRQSYWLDPNRGFALLGHKYTTTLEDGTEVLRNYIEVSKLKEVAAGIWWPTEASKVSRPYEPGKPYRRFVYRASNVVANNPNFDENIFTVPFPDGYLIDDQVAGRKYTVGEQ